MFSPKPKSLHSLILVTGIFLYSIIDNNHLFGPRFMEWALFVYPLCFGFRATSFVELTFPYVAVGNSSRNSFVTDPGLWVLH